MEYLEVLRTGNPARLALIESLLQSGEIRYYLADSVSMVFGEGAQARVMVDRDRLSEAAELLAKAI